MLRPLDLSNLDPNLHYSGAPSTGCVIVHRLPCRFERLKAVSRPPFALFPGAVQFAMTRPAERCAGPKCPDHRAAPIPAISVSSLVPQD